MAVDSLMLAQQPASAPFTNLISNNDVIHKNRKHYSPPPTYDRVDRTSFSSVKETNSGGVQSFTDTKTSSYLRNEYALTGDEDAIAESDSETTTPVRQRRGGEMAGMLNPQSTWHGLVCPCDGFRGWKSINVGGKIASKSFGDLTKFKMRWDWDRTVEEDNGVLPDAAPETAMSKAEEGKYPAGRSPLEMLPMELLGPIIDQLATDIPPNGFEARNIDLMSLLLTSRGMHSATLATLYSQITIPHSRIFRKFLNHLSEYPSLGSIVRRLDFSHYNPTGGGYTARERQQTLNLIPATLLQCLDLTPNLQEFLAQEHIDDELDDKIIIKLLSEMPKLKALDFCACSSTKFRDSMISSISAGSPVVRASLSITRLSLHESTILPSSIFTTLLPRLPNLTHLDVAHTRITDPALSSIPDTARLTHLNLSKCASLSGPAVAEFLCSHPAAKSMVYLNLSMDSKCDEMLSANDLDLLLPSLPSTLRSLNLKGSKMNNTHIPLVLPLTKHLEELGVGRHLKLKDITQLFVPDQNAPLEVQMSWIPHTLRYIDVSDLSAEELDLGTLFGSSCPVLRSDTAPLEVMELSAEVIKKLERSASVKRAGWCLKELGRRHWLVREPSAEGARDSGARSWKMGACWWGMRKIPVSRQDVGGMYGHYMFKR